MKNLIQSINYARFHTPSFCLSVLISFAAISLPAISQDSSGCFMLDAKGNPLDLGHLCGGSPNNANSSTIRTNKTSTSRTADLIEIPIKRRVGGTPVIDVKFNDKYIFEMLFDTGATMTIITDSMAKKLKINSTGSLPFQTASNNMIFFKTGRVDSAMAGNMQKNNFNIAVAPTLDIGLLGQDFYGMYDITIKYGTIELHKR